MPIYQGAILSNPTVLANGVSSVMCKVYNQDGQKIPATNQVVINLYASKGELNNLTKADRVSFEAKAVLEAGPNDKPLPARGDKPELMIHRISGFKPETLVITGQPRKAMSLIEAAAAGVIPSQTATSPVGNRAHAPNPETITPSQKLSLMDKALGMLGLTRV